MKKEAISALLAEAIEQRKLIDLLRKKIDQFKLYGIPIAQREDLLLIANEYDFCFDGYKVIRKSDINQLHTGIGDGFFDWVFRQEQILPAPIETPLSLDNFQALLADLMKNKIPVIVEGKGNRFLLGAIHRLGKSKLHIAAVGVNGYIDSELTRTPYEEITTVTFGTRYLQLFMRYAVSEAERSNQPFRVSENPVICAPKEQGPSAIMSNSSAKVSPAKTPTRNANGRFTKAAQKQAPQPADKDDSAED